MLKIKVSLLILFMFGGLAAENEGLLSRAENAIARAKKENKYLVVYFYEGKRSSKKITKIISKAEKKWSVISDFIKIEAKDPEEREVVKKCGVTRVPFTSVIAPNGAITARFPGVAELEIVEKGFVSPKMAELLKAVQAENLVFMCLTNRNTKYGSEVLKTVKEAVKKLSGIAELIEVDPMDKREISLLNRIKVSPDIDAATTLVIAPTGIIAEKFTGKITQRDLFDSFQKILAMGSGCGSETSTGGSACDPSAGVGSSGGSCK